jgi:hypothetical protein
MSISSEPNPISSDEDLSLKAPPVIAMRGAAYLWGTQMSITNPLTALLFSKLYNATNGRILLTEGLEPYGR